MIVSDTDLTVGLVLKLCRIAEGRSARRLSLDAELSESVVGKVEAGAIEPSLRVFAAIVDELGLSPREIALLVTMANDKRRR